MEDRDKFHVSGPFSLANPRQMAIYIYTDLMLGKAHNESRFCS